MAAQTPAPRRWSFGKRVWNTGPNTTFLSARLAVMFFFLLDGTLLGSWFVRIPDVQRELGLSHGTLGLALLASAAGALITQPLTGWLVSKWESRRLTIIGAFAQCAVLTLPTLAPSFLTLALALLLLGAATGVIDVAMNVQGAAVEKQVRRPIMSVFHAFYSLGGVLGALTGGVVISLGLAPTPHLAGVALVFAAFAVIAQKSLISQPVKRTESVSSFARPSKALLRLGLIAFCVVLAEGAIGDWSAVYLEQTLTASAGIAAGGYATFSLAMTIGRLSGGRLSVALGETRLMRTGGVLVTAGMATVLITQHPAAALAAFGCVGLGLSCSFPLTISAAGRIPGIHPGVAIAAVNTAGYTGFLAGPPLIGFIAEGASLATGLGILSLVGIVMLGYSRQAGQAAAPLDKQADRPEWAVT